MLTWKRISGLIRRHPRKTFLIFNVCVTYVFYSWMVLFFRNFLEIIVLGDFGAFDDFDMDRLVVFGTLLFAIAFWAFISFYKKLLRVTIVKLFYKKNYI